MLSFSLFCLTIVAAALIFSAVFGVKCRQTHNRNYLDDVACFLLYVAMGGLAGATIGMVVDIALQTVPQQTDHGFRAGCILGILAYAAILFSHIQREQRHLAP